jgi:hypothetical protein
MQKRKVGILFGMEDTFPWALIERIHSISGDRVEAEPVKVSVLKDQGTYGYDVILDRISHEVPFYRTFMKCAAATGTRVVNNPYWWSADDKFFDNLVARALNVAVPKTILLPHKQHPPNTQATSFRNLSYVDWDDVFDYLGFPIFMKPADGGGWRDVYKVHDRDEFFSAYDQTRDLSMMAQEAIEFTEYYRCYVLGRSRVRVMLYDPKRPFHERYVTDPKLRNMQMEERVGGDALKLCEGLGYDMNTCEFAVRDGIPYAIDFMNCAPDADRNSVGQDNFEWVVQNMAEVLVEKAMTPPRYEPTGIWPRVMLP